MDQQYLIHTFYKFSTIAPERVRVLRDEITATAEPARVSGLVILGTEGINATVSGSRAGMNTFMAQLQNIPEIGELLNQKESFSEKPPFRGFRVAVRQEIVSLGTPDLIPQQSVHKHLSPHDWEKMLQEPDVTVIDTRNTYETKIGKFKNAVALPIEKFCEFPDAVKSLELKKGQKILIYCTGGIRCEKAILEMERQGFENVYQLDGGILNYLKEFPNRSWDGECFVFDYRVAVNQELAPSEVYSLCPHCGDPTQVKIQCIRCDQPATPCEACMKTAEYYATCSKNCAHHYEVRPGKGRPQLIDPVDRRTIAF